MRTLNDIRSNFISYFKENGHEEQASAALIPHNDPTLMFINAGMVPFKNIFTGEEKAKFSRVTSSQKCVRAGGKHNDLENVGYTARHHTFFEMLGNFSFGDYFKEEAIFYAWEFITKELSLPKDKLYLTVYNKDQEAFNLWKKISGFSDDKIIKISTSDNFWSMGETGPCGPCSEIFYDHGDHIFGGLPGTKDEDGDRFVEIWNLVFMQYEKKADGSMIDLPNPCIDTGMGLERIAAVMQGKHDNYDIDLFERIIKESIEITKKSNKESLFSHRIIADHLRAASFLISDGVMPSNEGRGYVLRRIMRRAMRHANQLGHKKPLLVKLYPVLKELMGNAYPELVRASDLISETLKVEEENFGKTLDKGLVLLESEVSKLSGKQLDGEVAFKLYDTYGFPLDLTIDILKKQNISVDEEGFEDEMNLQKERAKASWAGSGEIKTNKIWSEISDEESKFLGYKNSDSESKVKYIIKNNIKENTASTGDEISIILDQTPFYGESGGQEGDKGIIENGSTKIKVLDTKKIYNLIVHNCKIEQGTVNLGDVVTAKIDSSRRKKLKANHSATHILHYVLRKQLGNHITQKGSLVAENKLRFDFSHNKALSNEIIRNIENEVNQIISDNSNVSTNLMEVEKAIESGAMALFGEKYDDEVRVVAMGDSIELCGGTHVQSTGEIGLFKITTESAVASGIRRIEALTLNDSIKYVNNTQDKLNDVCEILKCSEQDLNDKIKSLLEERKKLQKQISDLRQNSNSETNIEKIADIEVLHNSLSNIPPKDLRDIATNLKKKISSGVVVVIGEFEGKGTIVVLATDNICEKYNASKIVNIGAQAMGGKGGGKNNFAMAGGPEGNNANNALTDILNYIKTI